MQSLDCWGRGISKEVSPVGWVWGLGLICKFQRERDMGDLERCE